MTLGEQLELAIYRFVESVGKGQGRTIDITTVTNLVTMTVEAVDIEPWTLSITVEWQREANLLNVSQTVSTAAITA
jgi:hypothetical protein